ncbi:thioesterase family protein [Thermomonas sp.]|uniref:acyl-CoA thioesterase n=1 Tax=Thermomonas sp. TaxID=1971895 RepID=UPI00248841A7|nr:thioesterase family protein [Thermomonas sp.]MDI1252862.1 thioesterase family protein [Thermomonas sp.]
MSDADKDPSVLFQHAIEPRWRDLDAFGHVNNSNFLTYLEEARICWFETFDGQWVNDAIAPLLAAVQLNYRAPIDYPASIIVELFAQHIGTTSLTVGHRIRSTDGSVLHADGHVVTVWIDRATGRPIALPDLVLKALR